MEPGDGGGSKGGVGGGGEGGRDSGPSWGLLAREVCRGLAKSYIK